MEFYLSKLFFSFKFDFLLNFFSLDSFSFVLTDTVLSKEIYFYHTYLLIATLNSVLEI